MVSWYNPFMYTYKNLNKRIKNQTPLFECLNAIGILENLDWKGAFKLYVDTLHTHANGPSEDEKNIQSILKESGYSEILDRSKFKGYAIIQRGNHFYALIQKNQTLYQYGVQDPKYIDTFEEYRIFIKDFQHSYKPLLRSKEHNESMRKNRNVSYSNSNPRGKFVGDCSIRALAKGLHINWNDSLDLLADTAFKMNELHFNTQEVVEKVLEENGFIKHKYFPVKLTCSQFCIKMDQMYPNADILVYAGNHHVTALMKEYDRYVIQDTWDCSNELAGYYFVKERKNQSIVSQGYEERIVIHPKFGQGIVYKQVKNKLYISFDAGDKILLEDWVLKNCKFE